MGVSVSVVSPRKLTTGNVRRKTKILVKPPLSIKSASAARGRRSPFGGYRRHVLDGAIPSTPFIEQCTTV